MIIIETLKAYLKSVDNMKQKSLFTTLCFPSYIHFHVCRCKVCREFNLTRLVMLPNKLEGARGGKELRAYKRKLSSRQSLF